MISHRAFFIAHRRLLTHFEGSIRGKPIANGVHIGKTLRSIFRVKSVMASTIEGQFLVATNHLRDPNFYRTVVLMLEHSDENAMGLIINRPSSISIDAAMAELKQPTVSSDPIYSGGPVETSALFILHSSAGIGTTDSEIADGIFLTGSNDSFEALLNSTPNPDNDCRFRIYCGYAGWGPGQLESEIDRGDWRTLPAVNEFVFEQDPYEIWEVCTQAIQMQNRLLPHRVRNPEWN